VLAWHQFVVARWWLDRKGISHRTHSPGAMEPNTAMQLDDTAVQPHPNTAMQVDDTVVQPHPSTAAVQPCSNTAVQPHNTAVKPHNTADTAVKPHNTAVQPCNTGFDWMRPGRQAVCAAEYEPTAEKTADRSFQEWGYIRLGIGQHAIVRTAPTPGHAGNCHAWYVFVQTADIGGVHHQGWLPAHVLLPAETQSFVIQGGDGDDGDGGGQGSAESAPDALDGWWSETVGHSSNSGWWAARGPES